MDDAAKCQQMRERALKNPVTRFLLNALGKAGCTVDPVSFIACEPCGADIGGGYRQGEGIVLCEDKLMDQEHTNLVLAHELIHAFDDCRAKVDWDNCVHHACSEIRAANLSGDCKWSQEFRRGYYFEFAKQHQVCVRRRALLSLAMNPSCPPEKAKEAVDKAWDVCFADTAPFDRVP
mmetsp:Transcript_5842/g.8994  ORF Transcript_5842/g.8994 Transcript_5842/m.8994 type:complete len:177 (+) Transcript_5842:67-597(+)